METIKSNIKKQILLYTLVISVILLMTILANIDKISGYVEILKYNSQVKETLLDKGYEKVSITMNSWMYEDYKFWDIDVNITADNELGLRNIIINLAKETDDYYVKGDNILQYRFFVNGSMDYYECYSGVVYKGGKVVKLPPKVPFEKLIKSSPVLCEYLAESAIENTNLGKPTEIRKSSGFGDEMPEAWFKYYTWKNNKGELIAEATVAYTVAGAYTDGYVKSCNFTRLYMAGASGGNPTKKPNKEKEDPYSVNNYSHIGDFYDDYYDDFYDFEDAEDYYNENYE